MYLYNLSNSPMLISEGHPQYIWITMSLGCLLAALAPVRIRYKGCFAGIPYTWYFWGWCVPHQATLPRASLYGNNITLQGREMCSLPLAWPFLSREWDGTSGCSHCLPPGRTGEGGDEGEDAANIIPGQFQQTPQIIFNPLMLNLKLELASWEKRGWSL